MDAPVHYRTVTKDPPASTNSVTLVRQEALEDLPIVIPGEFEPRRGDGNHIHYNPTMRIVTSEKRLSRGCTGKSPYRY